LGRKVSVKMAIRIEAFHHNEAYTDYTIVHGCSSNASCGERQVIMSGSVAFRDASVVATAGVIPLIATRHPINRNPCAT